MCGGPDPTEWRLRADVPRSSMTFGSVTRVSSGENERSGISGLKWLQYAVTAALLLGLLWFVDLGAVAEAALQADPVWLLAAVGCVLLARLAVTFRWRQLLAVSGHPTDFRHLFRVVSAGMGLGALLPTSVGPDVARGVLLARAGEAPVGSGLVVASLLLDRYAATVGTLIVAAVGALLMGYTWLALGLAAVILGVAAATVLAMAMAERVLPLATPGPLKKLRPKLAAFVERLRAPGMVRRGLVPAILISTLMTVARTGIFICLYAGLGHPVPVGLALFAIPLMLIALMAPVTVGGFGVREWVLVVSFQDLGIPPEVSVSVGILAFALQLAGSAPAILRIMIQRLARPRAIAEGADQ